MTRRSLFLAASILLGACGSAAATSAAAATTSSAASTSGSATMSPGATTAAAATAATSKASANSATNAELIAALTANGVPNPSQWAREVQEYRPYASTDAAFAKLKGELAKYNPSADTLAKILASLSLP